MRVVFVTTHEAGTSVGGVESMSPICRLPRFDAGLTSGSSCLASAESVQLGTERSEAFTLRS